MPEKRAFNDVYEIPLEEDASHVIQFIPVPVRCHQWNGPFVSVLFHEVEWDFTGIGDDIIRRNAHGGCNPPYVFGQGKAFRLPRLGHKIADVHFRDRRFSQPFRYPGNEKIGDDAGKKAPRS